MNEAPGPGCSLVTSVPAWITFTSDVTLAQVTALSANISHAWLRGAPALSLTFCRLQYTEGHCQPVDSVSLAGAGHLLDPGPDLGSLASPWPGLNMTRARVTDDQHPD